MHDRPRETVRTAEGRSPKPTAGIVDSQSVKADATVTHASRGFDAGKKINGRKRHLLPDTLGLLLAVLVTPASTTDRDAARSLLPAAKNHLRRLVRVWADGG
nr:transposase [Streptomyces sp. SID1328]